MALQNSCSRVLSELQTLKRTIAIFCDNAILAHGLAYVAHGGEFCLPQKKTEQSRALLETFRGTAKTEKSARVHHILFILIETAQATRPAHNAWVIDTGCVIY